MFLDDSACNLASIRLTKYLDADQNFDINSFLKTVRLFISAQDALVDYASYPTEKIAKNSHDFRPLGLGFADLGSLLMQLGIAYDSERGRAYAAALAALMTGQAYLQSCRLAQKIKPFAGFQKNKSAMLKVLSKQQQSLKKIKWVFLPAEFEIICKDIWCDVLFFGKQHGFRNSQVTVIAPTGTIGLVMDCDTTGIEPDYALVKNKKLSGGGSFQIVNQSVAVALKNLKYNELEIQNIIYKIKTTGSIKKSDDLKPEHLKIFETATGDLILSPEGHLLMMAAVQPFISGAISKTVNIPNKSTVSDISKIYKMAWQLKLKSVTIYRDGSKFAQPLSNVGTTSKPRHPLCSECGHQTQLESGCYRCVNCGTTTSCAS